MLVLQNLGFERVPVWHYAVVVGFDGDDVILRSGTEQRRVERSARFLRSWQRGSNWAFVAVEPGELPATATAGRLCSRARRRGAAARRARRPSAATARRSSAGRATSSCCSPRPGNGTRAGDLDGATALYRRLLARGAAARGGAQQPRERARRARLPRRRRSPRRAPRSPPLAPSDELAAAVRDTVAELERAAAQSSGPAASCE